MQANLLPNTKTTKSSSGARFCDGLDQARISACLVECVLHSKTTSCSCFFQLLFCSHVYLLLICCIHCCSLGIFVLLLNISSTSQYFDILLQILNIRSFSSARASPARPRRRCYAHLPRAHPPRPEDRCRTCDHRRTSRWQQSRGYRPSRQWHSSSVSLISTTSSKGR